MQSLLLAEGILGLSNVQIALLLSGVALVFSIRRWRQLALRKKMAGQAQSPILDKSPIAAPTIGEGARRPSGGLNVREMAAELSALVAELEETARRVAAQVENRQVRLEQLLKEADEKIKRLETLTQGDTTGRSAAAVETAKDAKDTLSRLRQERGAPAPGEDPAYRPIYQMADQGKNSREIAQELGRQPGEVELILALRGR